VRTANNGYSVLIDPRGRLFDETHLFQSDVPAADIPLSKEMTIYGRWGKWYPVFFIVLFFAGLLNRRNPAIL